MMYVYLTFLDIYKHESRGITDNFGNQKTSTKNV